MLRKIIPLALVLAVGAFTYAGTSVDAAAYGAQEFASEQADHASGFLCGILGGLTTNSRSVISDSGNETLTCADHFALTGQKVQMKGVLCGLFFGGLTTNSYARLNPSGASNLWCKG